MTIKLLKDCLQYGAKWTSGRVIADVYPPDARRMIKDGEAEEWDENVLVRHSKKSASAKAVEPPKES